MNDGSEDKSASQVGALDPPLSNRGYASLHLGPQAGGIRVDYLKRKWRGDYLDPDGFRVLCDTWRTNILANKRNGIASGFNPHFICVMNGAGNQFIKGLITHRSALFGEVLWFDPSEDSGHYTVTTEIKGQQCTWVGWKKCQEQLDGVVGEFVTRGNESLNRVDFCLDICQEDLVSSLGRSVQLAWFAGKARDPYFVFQPHKGSTLYINGPGYTFRIYEKYKQIAYGTNKQGVRYGNPEEALQQYKQVFGREEGAENWCRVEVQLEHKYLAGTVGGFKVTTWEEMLKSQRKVMRHLWGVMNILAGPPNKGHSERNVVHPYWAELRDVFIKGYQDDPPMRSHMPVSRMNSDARIRRLQTSLRKIFVATYDGPVADISYKTYMDRLYSVMAVAFRAHDDDSQEIYRVMAEVEAYRAEYGLTREEDFQDDF